MPTRLAVLGATVLLAVSGCSEAAETAAPAPVAVPSTAVEPVAEVPAATAGGACALWDYDVIEKTIGVRFSVAASDQAGGTSTCVVQPDRQAWPDLSLSVVRTTTAGPEIFLGERVPAGAAKLTGLGRAAYRLNAKATAQHGPTVEIGWLSQAKQLRTLRFTFARGGADQAKVTAMNAKLLNLAKALNTTDG
ncbi:hypothetical protein [Actinoplanes utahensis]|uniref:DUF3558 domain-containing protein n=1 Tax=Actinoplanes utahensis TaxID=1869 RepID=A0A0A6UFC2_ACTUT|nr:hypothetical protein [Actinoplanes utahensis]KHD73081.1 hypothetical protein MB27_36180 [Actinoplanes utahensis]KHD74730.1 hypothetical protein MB27_26820 [Actinoplanes utahensis]GIF34303.1 hypothetical protein Aut01nite_72890 [Actinoplanes utahensis]